AHQKESSVGSPVVPPATTAAVTPGTPTSAAPGAVPAPPPAAGTPTGVGVPNSPNAQMAVNPNVTQAGFVSFPHDKLPDYAIPRTPMPTNLTYDDNLLASGNVANGMKLVTTGMCVACHTIRGQPMMAGTLAPNLTHLASRTTIAG